MEVQDTMEMVVRDGVRFLESLTRHYGQDEGMRIWDGIGEVVGNEVKGQIFFAMLTGESSNRVKFVQKAGSQAGNSGNAVAIIKAIRHASGCGLKEAKDKHDLAFQHPVYVDCYDSDSARNLVRDLRNMGCTV